MIVTLKAWRSIAKEHLKKTAETSIKYKEINGGSKLLDCILSDFILLSDSNLFNCFLNVALNMLAAALSRELE